jgi:hypothetical protein
MINESEGKSEHEVAQGAKDTINDFWQDELLKARRRSSEWRIRAGETVQTYRGETDDDLEVFNILWSNTETLKGAIYSHTPSPDVTRRFLEDDKAGNTMAMVMERALTYCQGIRGHDFDEAMEMARDDCLLTGRGVVRVRYKVTTEDIEVEVEGLGPEGLPIVKKGTEEEKVWEEVFIEHVPWRDFEHSFGKRWTPDVWWEAFARDMTRDELVEKFGDAGRDIPLNGEMKAEAWENWVDSDARSAGLFDWYDRESYARVWEVWDSRAEKVIWVSEANPEIIEIEDDPYGLVGFFPCPSPLYAIKTSDTLVPIPEYTQYQYQAEELNIITRRLSRLTDALKVRAVGDAELEVLERLFDGEENEIILDEDYAKIQAQGGLEGALSWVPITIIADVIGKLSSRRDEVREEIYEITGISDILRGQSDPRETATAVKTKGRFGTLRIQQRQKAIQKFARDGLRLMGELIGELFDENTLILMAGVEDREDVVSGMGAMVQKFRDDAMRNYTIDIESDSTIAINEQQEKQNVSEFFSALASLLQQLVPAVQQGILPMPAAKAMLKYAANRFNAGRDLDEAIDAIGSQPKKPGADPAQQAQAQKAEIEQAKLQLQQAELEFKKQEAQMNAQINLAKLQIEMKKLDMKLEATMMQEQVKIITAKMDIEAARANRSPN